MVSERILLAAALWNSIVAEQVDIELTDAQKEELDRRLAAFEIDQDEGSSWSSVRARILDPGEVSDRVRSAKALRFAEAVAQRLIRHIPLVGLDLDAVKQRFGQTERNSLR